jgi:peptide-methionine (S)-S-oxide reductase
MTSPRTSLLAATGAALLATGLLAQSWYAPAASAAEASVRIPAPAIDPASTARQEVAVLAGGCFWGVQGVFQHVRGVTSAVSGYAGGQRATAQYETVGSGRTGHAESVRIIYDPRLISYGKLLQVYFSVVQDPTQLNRQGPDTGTQYRSAIFPTSPAQARVAQAYIAQLDAAHIWRAPIVTRIEPGKSFFPAEGYHQDYLALNPDSGYIRVNDLPKVEALRREFPALWRARPVLVRARG